MPLSWITGDFLYYHLILTDNCNLCCSYCRGKDAGSGRDISADGDLDFSLPVDLDLDLDMLYRFLEKDADPALIFYGGEPLLASDRIREIMDYAPVNRFILHTNGTLLHTLEPGLVKRFDTILVSIDGPEPLTDRNRGRGTYRQILQNLREMRSQGYEGEIIARMTVTEDTAITEAVCHLADNEAFPFEAIHWQIDANFWPDSGVRGDFERWVASSYNPGIRLLADNWVSRMEQDGNVCRWYPFLDTMEDLIRGKRSLLRCGCGHGNYSIMTDGSIAPCPIMMGMRGYYVGHISRTEPSKLEKVPIEGSCTRCGLFSFCGGRCLYSNITRPWPEPMRRIVCETVKNLHETLMAALPRVKTLIGDGRINLDDFTHEKYNSCEIIP